MYVSMLFKDKYLLLNIPLVFDNSTQIYSALVYNCRMCVGFLCMQTTRLYDVKPLKKGHIGDGPFVSFKEVVLLGSHFNGGSAYRE